VDFPSVYGVTAVSLIPFLGQQNWDDQAHLSFVQTHLEDLLGLLVEPGQLSGSGQALRDSQVGAHALNLLNLSRCR